MPHTVKIKRQSHNVTDSDDQIDFKKIFDKLVDHWAWFVISIAICLIAAILYLRYTPPLYVVNARVLINDPQSSNSMGKQANALMDLGGIMGASSSVDNEAEILKTPDLIESVVRDMQLNIVYSQRANLVTRELYRAPFVLQVVKSLDTIETINMHLTTLPGNKVRVIAENFEQELSWNQSFEMPGVGILKLVPRPEMHVSADLTYELTISSIDVGVSNIMNRMAVDVASKQVTIINLSLNYPVQKKGEEILTAIINKYKASNLEEKNAVADSTYFFIKKRLNVIASELGDVETKVERFKQQNNLADMSEQGKLLVQTTGQYTADLAKAETQITVLTELEEYLKDETKNKRVFPTALLPSDLVFSSLMDQYNSLLAERDRALMSVTEATPFVQNLNKQIDEMRRGILANIQSSKNTYIITRNKLKTQLNQAQGQIQGVPQIEKNYLQLARNQQIKQELYIFLMQKAEETAISKTSNISIAKVIAKPKAGLSPVSPSKKAVMAMSLFIGLFIPLILVVIKGLINTTVVSKDDITGATDVPVIGEISHNKTNDNLVVSHSGRSAVAEQFRALRSNLSFYLKNKEQNVLLLTSSMSGEGKSFTAINLANVLALLGKKVLLMELDLRKPGLSTKLDVRNDMGFSNYIIDEKLTTADIIKPLTAVNQNLSIITSGPLPPNPIEILLSERTTILMNTLKQQFDYVIMDAPPVGIIADAESLAIHADMTLYLVRQKVTQKGQLAIVDDLYKSKKINNLAIIVNDVSSKQYGYGYGYGSYGEDISSSNWFSKVFRRK
jgi:tyrosine-protein kinase Etk/Wzc